MVDRRRRQRSRDAQPRSRASQRPTRHGHSDAPAQRPATASSARGASRYTSSSWSTVRSQPNVAACSTAPLASSARRSPSSSRSPARGPTARGRDPSRAGRSRRPPPSRAARRRRRRRPASRTPAPPEQPARTTRCRRGRRPGRRCGTSRRAGSAGCGRSKRTTSAMPEPLRQPLQRLGFAQPGTARATDDGHDQRGRRSGRSASSRATARSRTSGALSGWMRPTNSSRCASGAMPSSARSRRAGQAPGAELLEVHAGRHHRHLAGRRRTGRPAAAPPRRCSRPAGRRPPPPAPHRSRDLPAPGCPPWRATGSSPGPSCAWCARAAPATGRRRAIRPDRSASSASG